MLKERPRKVCADCETPITKEAQRCRPCADRRRQQPSPERLQGYDPEPVLAQIRGLSNEEAAWLLDVNKSVVARWRQGYPVGRRVVDKVATRLGLHMDILWPEHRMFVED